MSDFKTRLIEEKAQLDERLDKLLSFQLTQAFKDIAPIQQALLNVQAMAMASYSQCISERLNFMEP